MTTTDFQNRHPQPWHFQMCETTASLRDANGKVIGHLTLSSGHSGIPQNEWNRHVAAALENYLKVLPRTD